MNELEQRKILKYYLTQELLLTVLNDTWNSLEPVFLEPF